MALGRPAGGRRDIGSSEDITSEEGGSHMVETVRRWWTRTLAVGLLTLVAACGTEPVVNWAGIVSGSVVGDVSTDIQLSSLGFLYHCATGAVTRETFSARVRTDGTFRAFASDNNTGPEPRCFDLLVERNAIVIDTLPELGPINFFSDGPTDSLSLVIRVFQNDSATVEQSVTLSQRVGAIR